MDALEVIRIRLFELVNLFGFKKKKNPPEAIVDMLPAGVEGSLGARVL